MKLKVALEVAHGTAASIHKMDYACSVEDTRHQALDALLVAYENIKILAAIYPADGVSLAEIEEMEKQ